MNSDFIYGRATLVASLLTIVFLIIAVIMQYGFKMMPCPLCLVQRGVFVLLFITILSEYLSRNKAKVSATFRLFSVFFSAAGMGIAGRHVWLQNTPASELPSCLPSLDYLIDTFSFAQIITKVFAGSSECSEVSWTFLGLTIPEQTFIIFFLYFIFSLIKFYPFLHQGK
ncbi:disulfide bond formation protein B [Pseudoalteromonas sp. MMG022]|uniref:disulfide bond formation protein B n=1 Tax=Pseudoalteromonas sp. MMG022 TaxID=2909978 RepID=UPI0031B9EF04|nr:disulfide bond formation protein B [Pseudoalteromonas sp. MMG022]